MMVGTSRADCFLGVVIAMFAGLVLLVGIVDFLEILQVRCSRSFDCNERSPLAARRLSCGAAGDCAWVNHRGPARNGASGRAEQQGPEQQRSARLAVLNLAGY